MASATSTSTSPLTSSASNAVAAGNSTTTSHDIDEAPDGLLPQYGFGKTYAFDTLVERHRFLFRVHTPKRKHGPGSVGSRATSPQPSTRATSPSPFATPLRNPSFSLAHSRSPSTSASVRSGREGSDYFGLYSSPHVQSQDLADEGDDEDGAPGDPYFLSRQFKDDLSSSDVPTRRRTMSTLSTLSGGSTAFGGYGQSHEHGRPGLDRSATTLSAVGGGRTRKDSVTRPGSRRSHSVDVGASFASSSSYSASHAAQPSEESRSDGASMTYDDLVRHLDWTTRSSSPYVTTSFSFFWCLWEAVRRYKLSVKQDVEIAVIDARSVVGRARTALEILRGVEGGKQDKAYWKWFRFALESQDVLVFGAIPGDAIYASIPLTSILPRLPSYFFKPEPQVGLPAPEADPREPVGNAAADEVEDPRSPSSRSPTGTQMVFFPPSTPGKSSLPGTPGRPFTPRSDLSSYDLGSSDDGEERRQTAQLLSRLSWDIGTSLKPRRKTSVGGSSSAQAPRHTSHADFCRALTRAFEGVEPGKNGEGRKEEDKLRDATTSAVKLAEVLIEPWFRARCAEAADPFRFDDSDSESSEGEDEGLCLGLAGDGCSLEHRHDRPTPEDDTETEDPRMEAAETLAALSLDLARWPSNWWFAERRQGIEGLVKDVVGMCVRECARGVGMRVWWGVQSEYESQRRRAASEVGSPASSFLDERKGRRRAESLITSSPEPRGREVRSRSAASGRRATLARRSSDHDGSPSKSYPSPVSIRESPYKPRARSPLGAVPALGPAIVLKSGKHGENDAAIGTTKTDEGDWSPTTPPPTPPLSQSLTLSDSSPGSSMLDSSSIDINDGAAPSTPNKQRRSPPPPPPRSAKRERETTLRKPASFASLDSSIESLRALDSPQGFEGDVPGGWPDSENDTQLGSPFQRTGSEGAPRTPPSQKVQRRPFSWSPGTSAFSMNSANATGTGSSHQRSASDGSSLADSRKSSQESLRPYGSTTGNLQPSPSPKPSLKREGSSTSSPSGSIRRSPRDKDGETRDGEAFLAEVVSSALNLGVTPTAVFNLGSSPSPLKVDTAAARRDSQEKAHKRHSSLGEIDLSPVVELSGEKEAEEEEARARGESVFSLGSAMQAVEDLTLTANVAPVEDKVTFAEPEGLEEVPSYVDTSRYSRSRRSSTLASIPEAEREEEWEDWTMIDVPTSMAASLKSTSSSSASVHEPDTVSDGNAVTLVEAERPVEETELAAEIPLPPSPVLAPSLGEEEPSEILEEMMVGEPVESSGHERRSSVPEITLSVPQTAEPLAPTELEQAAVSSPEVLKGTQTDIDNDALQAEPISNPLPEPESATDPVLLSPEPALKRVGRAVLKSMGLSFLIPTLSRHHSGASSPSTPSPVLDDADMSTALVRWSPMFSALRYWSPFFRPHSRPHQSQSQRSQSQSRAARRPSSIAPSASQLILGPRPAWDAPILEGEMALGSGGMDLDDAFEVYSQGARSGAGFMGTSWAMSCFVCGVMASLALASVQRQREMQMLMGNRYY